jgi:hypothetical protein
MKYHALQRQRLSQLMLPCIAADPCARGPAGRHVFHPQLTEILFQSADLHIAGPGYMPGGRVHSGLHMQPQGSDCCSCICLANGSRQKGTHLLRCTNRLQHLRWQLPAVVELQGCTGAKHLATAMMVHRMHHVAIESVSKAKA